MIKVAINGFGRIGRNFFKLAYADPDIKIVAINDIAPIKALSHLLKYDSIHGIFSEEVLFRESESNNKQHVLLVNQEEILFSNQKDITKISWQNTTPDVVIECSGKFKNRTSLENHLKAGGKKVILGVPPEDDSIKIIVVGVNHTILKGDEDIISCASCTTNNAAPLLKVIDELAGIEQAYITTVHSYTSDQSLHDQPHRDLRRARAAGQNIVPTTTGAAKALTKIFPNLEDVIGGCGIRIPIPNGSLTDVTINVNKDVSMQLVNKTFQNAAKSSLNGILEYSDLPLVSTDILGNKHSCIFDSKMTSVIGKMVKLIGWYDNEIGYSHRLIDLIKLQVN